MTDVNLQIFARSFDAVLQFVGEHHLGQLALAVDGVGAIVLIPVHIVELDGFDAQIIPEAGNNHDPASAGFELFEQFSAQQEVAVVVGSKLAFKPVNCQLLCGHLSNCSVADQRINSGQGREQIFRRSAHR